MALMAKASLEMAEKIEASDPVVGSRVPAALITYRVVTLLGDAAERAADLGDDESLLESGLVDSLNILGLVNGLEDHFDLEFDDEDLQIENFETIGKIMSLLEERRGNG